MGSPFFAGKFACNGNYLKFVFVLQYRPPQKCGKKPNVILSSFLQYVNAFVRLTVCKK